MNVPRVLVALSIEHNRLVAISAAVSDRVKIKRWHTAPTPQDLDLKDTAAVGKWVAAELAKAGMQRSKIVISVPRGEVVLKRLRLPRADASEIAGMVRLQMSKQLTMAVEGTAIDYLPLQEEQDLIAGAAAGEGTQAVTVMAAALPGDRMNWYRAVVKAAGCKLHRVGLRAAGLAALLSDVSQRHTGPILGISVGWGSVEFVVVEHGNMAFVRAADVGMSAGEEGELSFVHRVGVEVKRTWMSYRVGEGSAEVDAVVLPGEGELPMEIAQRCGEALEMPWKLAPLPAVVDVEGSMPPEQFQVAAPLIGLLTEESSGRPMLDFANPRKAPDMGAARRQRVLAAVFAMITVVGAGYLFTSMQLAELRSELSAAKDKDKQLQTQYAEMLKEDARLNHMRQWQSAGIDWVAHCAWLSEQMPDPRQAQLVSLTGVLGAEVVFTPKAGGYDPSGWQLQQIAGFSLDGKSKSQQISNDLRNKLLSSDVYELKTKGADVGDSFKLELTTQRSRPDQAPPTAPKARRNAGSASGAAAENPGTEAGAEPAGGAR